MVPEMRYFKKRGTEIFARRWRNTSLEVTRVMLIYFPIHQKKEGGETVEMMENWRLHRVSSLTYLK